MPGPSPQATLWKTTASPVLDTIPRYFLSSAGIPRTQRGTEIGSRHIRATSRIFLSVDTAQVPGPDVALPGVRVNNHGDGWFTVSALDESTVTATAGLPFSYLVVNELSGSFGARPTGVGPRPAGLSYLTGTAAVPAGAPNVGVDVAVATSDSTILLTVDATAIQQSSPMPGLKVNNKGDGWFTVTTLGLEPAPKSGIPFNWMVVNGAAASSRGTAGIPARLHNAGQEASTCTPRAAVLLTVDATSITGPDVALPGVKVNNRGDGWFTVTTAGLQNAGPQTVPFDWLVVAPLPQWEEYGPTAISGNTVSIAVDPTNWRTVYAGSRWGGLFKTVDGGQNWHPSWDQQQVGIYRVLIDPLVHTTVYALDFLGRVWRSTNAGVNWVTPFPALPTELTGGALQGSFDARTMIITPLRELWVASDAGLVRLLPGASSWIRQDDQTTGPGCTDVAWGRSELSTATLIYAAFRTTGVFRGTTLSADLRGGWGRIKQVHIAGNAVRVAVSRHRIVVNELDTNVFTNTLPQLGSWVDHGPFNPGNGDGPVKNNGWALTAAVSPTDDDHFVAFGGQGSVTFDGGASTIGAVPLSQDRHQVVFFDDQHLACAADNGPRSSSDGGRTWAETEDGPNRITNGPPVTEFYRLEMSKPDRFGRVAVGGNVQDAGAARVIGNQFGFNCCSGEQGMSVASAPGDGVDPSFGMPASVLRYWGTAGSEGLRKIHRYEVTVPGPFYVAPAGREEDEFPGGHPAANFAELPLASVTVPGTAAADSFPAAVTSMASHPTDSDHLLVGMASGDIYRTTVGSGGGQFELCLAAPVAGSATTIRFTDESTAYAGFSNGKLARLTDPFAAVRSQVLDTPACTGSFSSAVAIDSADGSVYVAQTDAVALLETAGTLDDATGPINSGLGEQLRTSATTRIVGLSVDPLHRFAYVATGREAGTVWRRSLSAAPTDPWTPYDTGLPTNIPLTGIAVAPDRGVYVSTFGRGLWWRRDLR